MHLKTEDQVTMKYNYGNKDEEYVFCYKGRPFSMLVSSSLPTPATTYIDHLLVQELGIKICDIQCKKISFGGRKLRLLGKISCTVQCVVDGNVSGNFHFKGSVIENLNQHFDTHSVAGIKTIALLGGSSSEAVTTPPRKPSSSSSGSTTPASIPSECSTPTRILLQKLEDGARSPVESPSDIRRSEAARALVAARTRPRSPPGFAATPQYSPRPPPAADMSPLTSNITRLDDLFGGADVQPHDHAQLRVLRDQHPHGQVIYSNGVTNFYTTEGYDYMLGHGREKCYRENCYDGAQDVPVPHNCAFSGHWTFPHRFGSCGPRCQGAFCSCLRLYR